MSSNAEREDIIVFDNLVRQTDVIGEYASVKAKRAEPFLNSNAAGQTREIGSRDELSEIALNSGKRLRQLFSNK